MLLAGFGVLDGQGVLIFGRATMAKQPWAAPGACHLFLLSLPLLE